jgi:hypothetical protein
MARRVRAPRLLPIAIAGLVLLGLAGPAAACDRVDLAAATAAATETATVTAVTTTASAAPARTRLAAVTPAATSIVPGSVHRTSLKLGATYATQLTLRYGSRWFGVNSIATITNTSGGPIDRVELNTVAARLGGMTLRLAAVDGRRVSASVRDQTIIVPLGGVLPDGATASVRIWYAAHLRTTLSGSSWMFTRANGIVDAYRWIPWVSRATPFDRPNHGDPFVTPVSPSVSLTVATDRRLVIVTTADRVSVSSNGLIQRFVAKDVRDVSLAAAPDFRSTSVLVGATRVSYYYRSGANAARTLDAAVRAFRSIQARLGDYPYPTYKVVQSAGGFGMESPRVTWIPFGVGSANLRYLVTHETAHQWFYGLVGNDQARAPFADEAAADFTARYVLGLRRGSRCSASRLDHSIYAYSSACYYEVVYIQGGNLLDTARRRMGSTAFWRAMRIYVAAHRYGLVAGDRTILQALDDATSLNLGASLFAPRFPSYY